MKVIKRSNFPTKLPIMATVFWCLCMDYWHAPQWLYGVYFTIFGIAWIGAIYQMLREEDTDIFETSNKDNHNGTAAKTTSFMEKLHKRMQEKRESE